MAKNWEKVEIGIIKGKATLIPKKDEPVKSAEDRRPHLFNLKKVKSKSYEDLKKEGDKLYLVKQNQEDSLVNAFNEGNLKSKTLIQQAKTVIKRREKEAEEAAKKAAAKERRDAIVDTNTAIA